jgi:hypothetical protein
MYGQQHCSLEIIEIEIFGSCMVLQAVTADGLFALQPTTALALLSALNAA